MTRLIRPARTRLYTRVPSEKDLSNHPCSFRNISLPVLFQGFALLPDEKLESHPRGREESRCLHRRLINSCGTDASRCMPVPFRLERG